MPNTVSCAAMIAFTGGVAAAQPHFSDVPHVYTRTPDAFAAVFQAGRCRPVTAIIVGDSQETSPGSWGRDYIPRLNYELHLRYGNSPATPFFTMRQSTGGGSPPAEWLVRTTPGNPGISDTPLPQPVVPPGISPGRTSSTVRPNINANQSYGLLAVLQHDAVAIAPGTGGIAGAAEYFKRGQSCYIDVYARTFPGSGEITVRALPSDGHVPNYFVPASATFTTQLGLDAPEGSVLRARLGPLPYNGRAYMQAEISGSDSARFTDLITARFVSAVDGRGWAVTDLAAGGYSSRDWVQNHPDFGAIFGALEPDIVLIALGTNDAGRKIGSDDFEANLRTLIARLRSWSRPDLPVVLVTDPYSHNIPPEHVAILDLQAGVHLRIAQTDPFVAVLNSRRLTHEHGWTPANQAVYLADRVHYTSAGAILKAQVEVGALWDAFGYLRADVTRDGAITSADITAFLSAWFTARAENTAGAPADFDGDNAVTTADITAFLSAWFAARTGC